MPPIDFEENKEVKETLLKKQSTKTISLTRKITLDDVNKLQQELSDSYYGNINSIKPDTTYVRNE